MGFESSRRITRETKWKINRITDFQCYLQLPLCFNQLAVGSSLYRFTEISMDKRFWLSRMVVYGDIVQQSPKTKKPLEFKFKFKFKFKYIASFDNIWPNEPSTPFVMIVVQFQSSYKLLEY